MYGNDKEKETKLKSLKDLSHKMKGLQSSSLKGEQSHMDREDENHDDLNAGGNPSLPSDKKNISNPKIPNEHSNPGDSEAVHDEHGGNAHEPANEESDESPKDLHRSQREDSMHDDSKSLPEDEDKSDASEQHGSGGNEAFGDEESPEEEAHELSPLTLHPGLMKLLHEHLMSKK